MSGKSKIRVMATTMMLAIVLAAGTASAKKISGWMQDQSLTQPNGTVYTGCGTGGIYWGGAYAYDSSGVLQCGIRSEAEGQFLTYSGCPASAVTFQASMRATGRTFCQSAQTAWSGPWAVCTANLGFSRNGGACIIGQLTAFARGY